MDDDGRPPGWETNPSSWSERLPIVGLALIGFAIAAYLSFFQLGIIRQVLASLQHLRRATAHGTFWRTFLGTGPRRLPAESGAR